MPSGKEIRNKIKSVESTRKITKAMEMVAASKMRKAQDRMRAARPYSDKIGNIAANLSKANPEYQHPFMVSNGQAKAVGFDLARGCNLHRALLPEGLGVIVTCLSGWLSDERCICTTRASHTELFSAFPKSLRYSHLHRPTGKVVQILNSMYFVALSKRTPLERFFTI